MKGIHEDRDRSPRFYEDGSDFLYAVYKRGDVVRMSDTWGVVTRAEHKYNQRLFIFWLDENGRWYPGEPLVKLEKLSAPYSQNDASIPDEVLAKSTYLKLVEYHL